MMKWLYSFLDPDGLRGIKKDPYSIRHIEFPTWKQQMCAIQLAPKSIACIKNPDTLVVYEAVRLDPSAIKFISDVDDELAEFAIGIDPVAFKYIVRKHSDISDTLYLKALDVMPNLIQYIANPTPEQQLTAVKSKHNAIGCIKKPTFEAQTEAITRYPLHIKHLLLSKETIIVYFEKIRRDSRWADKICNVSHANLTEDEWWEIVKEFPEYYEQMDLTEEQISYAQICS